MYSMYIQFRFRIAGYRAIFSIDRYRIFQPGISCRQHDTGLRINTLQYVLPNVSYRCVNTKHLRYNE